MNKSPDASSAQKQEWNKPLRHAIVEVAKRCAESKPPHWTPAAIQEFAEQLARDFEFNDTDREVLLSAAEQLSLSLADDEEVDPYDLGKDEAAAVFLQGMTDVKAASVTPTEGLADRVTGRIGRQLRHGLEPPAVAPELAPPELVDPPAPPGQVAPRLRKLSRRLPFTSVGILLGFVLGSLIGLCLPHSEVLEHTRYWFSSGIQILLTPLVVAAVVRGVASGTGNLISLKPIGWFISKVLVWFALSTVAALIIGLAVASIAPAFPQGEATIANTGSGSTEAHIANYLPAVFFLAAMFGLALPLAGPTGKPIKQIIDSVEGVVSKMAGCVPYIAPFAAIATSAAYTSWYKPDDLRQMLWCIGLLYGALFAYVALLLIAMKVLAGVRVRPFLSAMFQPAQIAFATTTSGAAMPLTMQRLVRLGIPENIVGFVVPTGGLFNLAGSALYLAFGVVLFVKRSGGDVLSWQTMLLMFTLMGQSKRVAGVPGGAFEVLRGYIGKFPRSSLISISMSLNWLSVADVFMDMGRTCVNVIGNSVTTVIVAAWERKIPPDAQIRDAQIRASVVPKARALRGIER